MPMMQAWENRLTVTEEQWTSDKVNIPPSKEIPNLDLQVVNYHRPVFGTFHSKFTVIDRRIALLQSSNIQDNDNLEMLAHIEGPIVDSFYDTALLSFGKPLDPPLPLLESPAVSAPLPWHEEKGNATGTENETLEEHTTKSPHYDSTLDGEARRVNASVEPRGEETATQAVSRHLSMYFQLELLPTELLTCQ